ncbi:MAG: tautomerase family protein [Magnetovibrio sp.]|nr:tautomerase family protein [Magnetovibrio sp.]|tara:strand:+ start:1623 stop:2015 length:393 start_codon:yes stop_codon:yes gene_type:complete
MPTAKVYALRKVMDPIKSALSDAIHECVSEALKFPPEKRLQRFFPMDEEDFHYGSVDRTEKYTVIEITMFEGRSVETIKSLINMLYEKVPEATGIPRSDIDITISELPRHAWGLQGSIGDEQSLGYSVAV